ncbi:hypothetical protein [Prescottella equi]|uniref:hypothetical protein n=1 Tax=Rhodococcus hoagii TaxID=43767 RepID=UPI0007CD735D|nr:hypothetical protein [Prescottella equi]
MTEPHDHTCRADTSCRGRRRNEHSEWIPATTENPNTLCQSCTRAVETAVAHLWDDYLGLRRSFRDRDVRPDTGPKSGTPTPQIPVNVHTDALMHEIEDTTIRCAEAITDVLRTPPADIRDLGRALEIVEPNITALLRVPEHDAMDWNRAGEQWIPVTYDGPTLALQLADLHRRARATLGVERARDRMPVPCPRCEEMQLGRWHGDTTVTCLACGSSWTEDDYHRLTLILADDYHDITPPRRERHLARAYRNHHGNGGRQ